MVFFCDLIVDWLKLEMHTGTYDLFLNIEDVQ